MSDNHRPTQEIYTIPNAITFVRLLLVPLAFSVLVSGNNDNLAFILFAVAAASDFLDGMVARMTHTESELGSIIDPLVDRLLIAAGVIGLYATGRIPLWIVILLIARDVWLLYGSATLRSRGIERVRTLYTGKIATALLLVGFAGLILNSPRYEGLGTVNFLWLPGFGNATYCVWIWFVYSGIVFSLVTMVWYMILAYMKVKRHDFESKTLPDRVKDT